MGGSTYDSQLDAFTLYHSIQEDAGRAPSGAGIGPALPALGHALAGSVATAGAKVFLYPLDLVITRLQVQRQLRGKSETESAAKDAEQEYSSLLDAAKKIYKTEGGLKPFYTGCASDVGKGIADSFLWFLIYTFLRQYEMKRSRSNNLSVTKELGVGIAAGCFSKFFTTPIANIVTRQQTAAMVAARHPDPDTSPAGADKRSVVEIAREIHRERGLAGFWAGYSISIILTINPAITFAVDNLLRSLLPKSSREKPEARLTFLIAALSKAIATALTYPAMLAKSRAQVAGGEEDDDGDGAPECLEKPDSEDSRAKYRAKRALAKVAIALSAQRALFLSLRKIYRTEGLSGLYSGLEGEILQGFLKHGFTMMMKEKILVGVISLYYFLLKATRRWPEDFQKVQDGASAVASDARQRAENVGETISEGVKSVVGRNEG